MSESPNYISEKQFEELTDSAKWGYVQSLLKLIDNLRIQAEKNCAECEKNLISVGDLNIDYLFEDWRECSEHCEECGEEEKRYMCQLQFEIINLLAEQMNVIRSEVNSLIKLALRKDDIGEKIRETLQRAIDEKKKNSRSMVM